MDNKKVIKLIKHKLSKIMNEYVFSPFHENSKSKANERMNELKIEYPNNRVVKKILYGDDMWLHHIDKVIIFVKKGLKTIYREEFEVQN